MARKRQKPNGDELMFRQVFKAGRKEFGRGWAQGTYGDDWETAVVEGVVTCVVGMAEPLVGRSW